MDNIEYRRETEDIVEKEDREQEEKRLEQTEVNMELTLT